MPANLPPEYFEAEKRFKQASASAEKIAALEDLISTIPKHKGTDKLRADLRKKLSQIRKDAISKKRGGRGDLYAVQKEGAAQIALVGFPNAGKSSLLACLTNANPVIAEYPVSTLAPLSGMMPFEDIQIQLVDLPPIGNEGTDGWVSGILRNADALLLIVDISDDPGIQAEILLDQLGSWNIKAVSRIDSQGATVRNPVGVYKRVLIAANKRDISLQEDIFLKLNEKYDRLYQCISISALKKENLEELKRALFEIAEFIRVYAKPPGKDPDFSAPFSIPAGSTVLDLARVIHKDFIFHLKYARIWGSAKFDGQRVDKNYSLRDRDIVEFHI